MTRFERAIWALDCFWNVVLFDGKPTETVSHHASLAHYRDGRKWGEAVCKGLNATLHEHHCLFVLLPDEKWRPTRREKYGCAILVTLPFFLAFLGAHIVLRAIF